MADIAARIARDAGVPELVELLADRLAPTDLQSLLLEVYARRARALAPNEVLRRYAGAFSVAVDGVSLVDGGFVDWTQRLLSDRKERLLISGIGTERLCTP